MTTLRYLDLVTAATIVVGIWSGWSALTLPSWWAQVLEALMMTYLAFMTGRNLSVRRRVVEARSVLDRALMRQAELLYLIDRLEEEDEE